MKNRERLQNIYGFLKRKIVPQLRYSQSVYEDVLNADIAPAAVWLDVGCGHQLLPPWRVQQEKELFSKAELVVGMDFDFPSLLKHRTITQRVQGIADQLPFESGSFDAATANMVVEHLNNPQIQFAEINRVLKPGGRFIFHTPNETGYFVQARKILPERAVKKLARLFDERPADDVFAVYYKANRKARIELLAEATNFEIERIKFVSSDAVCAVVPPLAAAELVWIRLLMRRSLRRLRSNLIVVLKKKTNAE